MTQEGISFIIICYNHDRYTKLCVDAIKKQENTNGISCEVLLVVQGDASEEITKIYQEWQNSDIPLRIIPETTDTVHSLKFRGYREAKYSLLAFLDDDTMIEPSWASEVFQFMNNHRNCGVCGGENSPHLLIEPPHWLPKFLYSIETGKQGEQETDDITESKGFVRGTGMTIRKEIIDKSLDLGLKLSDDGRNLFYSSSDECLEYCWIVRILGYRIFYYGKLRTNQIFIPFKISFINLECLYRAYGFSSAWRILYLKYSSIDKIAKNTRTFLTGYYFQSVLKLIYHWVAYLIKSERKMDSEHFLKIHYYLGRISAFSPRHLKHKTEILENMRFFLSNVSNLTTGQMTGTNSK